MRAIRLGMFNSSAAALGSKNSNSPRRLGNEAFIFPTPSTVTRPVYSVIILANGEYMTHSPLDDSSILPILNPRVCSRFLATSLHANVRLQYSLMGSSPSTGAGINSIVGCWPSLSLILIESTSVLYWFQLCISTLRQSTSEAGSLYTGALK